MKHFVMEEKIEMDFPRIIIIYAISYYTRFYIIINRIFFFLIYLPKKK